MIYLAMNASPYYGAGVCAANLLREFSKTGVYYDCIGENLPWNNEMDALIKKHSKPLTADVDMPLIQFAGPDLGPVTIYRGNPNVAIIFSEWDPVTKEQKANLRKFDVLIAGSEWNAKVIRDAGFECFAVQQGVDTEIFKPLEKHNDQFVLFSGGKFEHRKGQDLVIRAVKVLQERHPDILLVSAWDNIWGGKADTDIGMVEVGLTSQPELAEAMNQTDVGLFPNRCEGGTNLVLMEYLACGKPVIADPRTGQGDVLGYGYSIPLWGSDDEVVDLMVKKVEYLRENKAQRLWMGAEAALAMKEWSWARMAEGVEAAIDEYKEQRMNYGTREQCHSQAN